MPPVYTKRAVDVFSPVTGTGAARGASMAECQVWGTEVENNQDSSSWFVMPSAATETALDAAISAGAADGLGVILASETTYLIGPHTLGQAAALPPFIRGQAGTVLKAGATSASPTMTVVNPHAWRNWFRLSDLVIDCDNKHANGFVIHGSQFSIYDNIEVKNATGDGIQLHGNAGYGIYYNMIRNLYSHNNAARGMYIYSDQGDGQYYVADNVNLGFKSQQNGTHQYYFDYASGTFKLSAEVSIAGVGSGAHIYLDNVIDLGFEGCYLENYLSGGAGTGSGTYGYYWTGNGLGGIRIIGGRTAINAPAVAISTNILNNANCYVHTSDVSGAGVGGFERLRGTNSPGATGFQVLVDGATEGQFAGDGTFGASQTALSLTYKDGSASIKRNFRVEVGAADSGGTGYRTLRIPN